MNAYPGQSITFTSTPSKSVKEGYPIVRVYDYNEQLLLEDVPVFNNGVYEYTYTVPSDIELSPDDKSFFKVEFDYLYTDNTEEKVVYEFLVLSILEDKENYVSKPGVNVKITAVLDKPNSNINFSIIDKDGVYREANLPMNFKGFYEGYYVYEATYTPNLLNLYNDVLEFTGLDRFTIEIPTGEEVFYKNLYLINNKVVMLASQVREHIDKIRKNTEYRLGYEMEDLVFYLEQGLKALNSFRPLSNFTINTLPKELEYFLIKLSIIQAISTQFLAEGELSFDFSGNSLSLNVDITGYLSEYLSNVKEEIDNNLYKIKLAYVRKNKVGALGVDGAFGNKNIIC